MVTRNKSRYRARLRQQFRVDSPETIIPGVRKCETVTLFLAHAGFRTRLRRRRRHRRRHRRHRRHRRRRHHRHRRVFLSHAKDFRG